MNNRIYLDLDGTLANWQSHVFNTFSVFNPTPQQLSTHDTWKECGFATQKDFWKAIQEFGSDWWQDIKPFEHTQELWRLCNTLAPTCILSKTGPNPSAASGKMKWIAQHLGTKNFLLGRVKHFCAGPQALLIDDDAKNCAKFKEHGGHIYLWPAPYNDNRDIPIEDSFEYIVNYTLNWSS